ncbi:hypothetical protein [Chryseobacterium luquanense]|uniref:Uncharacterized protein n=1 Tax=Chryseobacterium luquanense TaxID=2983766 RepID=A0ABT3Y850_9FLAO|nr:hypothetical protein [Chryseobacterium luquanense]MCX8534340.1 hypothetical protein [Chryseobacterium luquanense]
MRNQVKDQIKREDLKENIMKRIIFSVNYQGVVAPNIISSLFATKFEKYFGVMETTYADQLDHDIYNFNEISDTLSIPKREIENQEVYRFSENKFGKDYVILDISKYFSTMLIECVQYEGIDLYLDFFSEYINFLDEEISFFKAKALRLRKLGGSIFFETGEIFNNFEKEYFNFDFEESIYRSKRSIYKDMLECADQNGPIINYVRSFDTGDYYDSKRDEIIRAFQVLLDIDSSYSEEALDALIKNGGNIKAILENTNNVHLFEIFKMSVTEQFLKSNSHG